MYFLELDFHTTIPILFAYLLSIVIPITHLLNFLCLKKNTNQELKRSGQHGSSSNGKLTQTSDFLVFPIRWSMEPSPSFFLLQCGKQLFLRKQLYHGNNTTYEHQTCTNVLLRTCRFLWSPYHRPSLYWMMLKLIKGKIHYFVKDGKTLGKICPHPSVIKVVMLTKIRQGTEGPSRWCRNFAESCFREETGNGVWKYMWPVWSFWYYQTVTCIALSANRKWWLGVIFGVPATLDPCYISVVFPSFCHCFVSVWEWEY